MLLSAERVIFAFSKEHSPALRLSAPSTLDVETLDCFSNQLRDPSDTIEKLDWDRVNPATGPIYVEGAEPGDTLKVTINAIDLDEKGTVCCLENEGTWVIASRGACSRRPHRKWFRSLSRSGEAVKMIGVIGWLRRDPVNTGTPGRHGGNMDTLMITEGSTIYFPWPRRGALRPG